jgi:hypothetical protein
MDIAHEEAIATAFDQDADASKGHVVTLTSGGLNRKSSFCPH